MTVADPGLLACYSPPDAIIFQRCDPIEATFLCQLLHAGMHT